LTALPAEPETAGGLPGVAAVVVVLGVEAGDVALDLLAPGLQLDLLLALRGPGVAEPPLFGVEDALRRAVRGEVALLVVGDLLERADAVGEGARGARAEHERPGAEVAAGLVRVDRERRGGVLGGFHGGLQRCQVGLQLDDRRLGGLEVAVDLVVLLDDELELVVALVDLDLELFRRRVRVRGAGGGDDRRHRQRDDRGA